MPKRIAIYRSEHISIKTPAHKKAPKPLLALIILALIYVVCSVTIHTTELFATDSFSLMQNNNATLNAQYETLLEMYHSLEASYKSLKNNYLDLRERYNDVLVEKSTLLITNQQYVSELKELQEKLESFQGMNEYICEKLAKQEKKYNDLQFTVDTYLDDYKKHLAEEQNKFIAEFQEKMQQQYVARTQQTKKPYREYFYSSYNKE